MHYFRRWRERKILANYPVSEQDWRHALAGCAAARRLHASDQVRLRVLVTLFLHEKSVEPVQGLALSRADRTLLAAHACLPILKLGMKWYRGWHALVIYPDLFIPQRTRIDTAGVVHSYREVLAGEAWSQGPVILSWQEILNTGTPIGHNVIVHEMAHKLDLLNGDANGFPPLHQDMKQFEWSSAFMHAWDKMHSATQRGAALPIDPYALQNPAEFFAVSSELFFEQPSILKSHLPDVYAQLAHFYRQQPLADAV